MGTWDVGILDNDTALDIEIELEYHYRAGRSPRRAQRAVLRDLGPLDPDEEVDVWLAIAATEAQFGRLTRLARRKALDLIATGKALRIWQEEAPEQVDGRRQALDELAAVLSGPRREPIAIEPLPPAPPFHAAVGDVLTCQLASGRWAALGVSEVLQHDRDGSPTFVVEVLDVLTPAMPTAAACLQADRRFDRYLEADLEEERESQRDIVASYTRKRIEPPAKWTLDESESPRFASIRDQHSTLSFAIDSDDEMAIARTTILRVNRPPVRAPTQGAFASFIGTLADVEPLLAADFGLD